MRRTGLRIFVVLILAVAAAGALAQSITTATLRGRVTNEGQGLPGVLVTVTSNALQGARTTSTSANGDFVFPGLPPGTYTVSSALQGFRTDTRTQQVTVGQEARLDVVLALAGVEAAATVVAKSETVSTSTPQAAQTFTKDLTDSLPLTRTLLSSVALSAGVNTNGPGSSDRIGNGVAPVVTISGGQSFDNLFTVDGAVITDNVRGTPNNLFIEDAIAETTTSTSTVSAEFGRFTGGVVNTVTKTGGNTFSGSFRTTFTNAAWSATTPAQEVSQQDVNPQYEATLGGPLWKDHVWFFGSGRYFDQTTTGQTTFTNLSYPVGDTEKRYQAKLTLTPVSNHTLTGNYLHVDEEQTNSSFCPTGCLDLASNVPARQLPQEILTVNYNGVLSNSFFVEGLYSRRTFSFENSGSPYKDLINGTIIRDKSRSNARYNSPTFCGVCDPEARDNRDVLVKGTWFLSTGALGSHNIVFGYDNFSGQRKANNYQSGSNYRIFATNTIITNNDLYPVIDSNSYIYYTPVLNLSKGTDALTHSAFVNDSWRLNDRLSINLGVRWDKNHAKDSNGVVRADDSAFSPRLAAAYDVTGKGTLRVGASYAKYVGAIQDGLVDSASDGGQPGLLIWYYDGAGATPINTPGSGAPLVTRAQALQQVFNWFFAQGCPDLSTCRLPLAYAFVPGLSTRFPDSLDSPSTNEYAATISGNVGSSFAYRVDLVRREGRDFYNTIIDGTTGQAHDEFGNAYDIGVVNNTNDVKRNYTGLHTSLSYRTGNFTGGLNWTWSHTLGSLNGETAASGPVANATQAYPEYKDPAWNNPYGSLATDERHRVKVFASYNLPFPAKVGSLNIAAVQSIDTGVPYGAVGLVGTRPYVTGAPAYATPPSSVNYYFTSRDAFRTDTILRTDLSLNFTARIAGALEIFVQPQVLNVLNRQGLIGVSTSVRTAVNSAAYTRFNPFTEAPVQGTNWDYAPTFGKARSNLDYQLPRTFTLAAGVRF